MEFKEWFKEVNLGASTDEPPLIMIVFEYYSEAFEARLALRHTINYINKLKETQ